MINTITRSELEFFLEQEHPFWTRESLQDHATEYLSLLDERLAPAVTALIREGKKLDYQHGEFSLYLIQAMRQCSYWETITLMDGYLKDPLNGKAMILRR